MDIVISLLDRFDLATLTGSSHYHPNRSPLRPTPFQRLPPGSVRPDGWLKVQLAIQLTGLNGRLFEVSDYLKFDDCGWVYPEKYGWEELPYWLRGYADLAFLTEDNDALEFTQKWIDAILNSQQSDGWFGPNLLRKSLENGPDLWPAMVLINVFRSYHEYSSDERIIPFLLKYFKYISNQRDDVFRRGWGYTRWSDNIDSIIWLYNRTNDSDWLLELIQRIHLNAANWLTDIPTRHNVNISQGFREPALYSLLIDPFDQRYIQATYNNFQSVMNEFGQFPGGGFAGDENCREGFFDPRQGFETCGIVELMHSCSILTRLTGDRLWADRCEVLAFNSLPSALDPFLGRATHYITSANSIQLDDHLKTEKQFQNFFPMLAFKPGVFQYRCCAHNYGFGWPYFCEELWLATSDNGLCVSMYSPCQITARVGPNDGIPITITEKTEYPFGELIEFDFQLSIATQFKMYLRVPEWCEQSVKLVLNGHVVFEKPVIGDASFIMIDRLWQNGDSLSFNLPMCIRTTTWTRNQNSVSLSYGPLSFSLDIDEQWNKIGGRYDWPEYEVLPKSNWNYGLLLASRPEWVVRRRKKQNADVNPFTRSTVPLEIEARGRRIPTWTADKQNVINPLPASPVHSVEADEIIKLVPMGATRLRVTAFPVIEPLE